MTGLEIRLVNDTQIQYFDEYNICLGLDLDIKDELLFLNIKEWRIVNDYGESPFINEVGLNTEQYQSLVQEIQFILTFIQRYLNRISFSKGIDLNLFWVKLNTELIYQEDSVVIAYDLKIDKETYKPFILEKQQQIFNTINSWNIFRKNKE